jgi:hypothetical protein
MSLFSSVCRHRIRSGIAALTMVVFAASTIPLGPAMADPPPWAPRMAGAPSTANKATITTVMLGTIGALRHRRRHCNRDVLARC